MGFIDSVDTMILGANTYAQAKDYWPYADDQGESGEKLNNLTKFVASSKLRFDNHRNRKTGPSRQAG